MKNDLVNDKNNNQHDISLHVLLVFENMVECSQIRAGVTQLQGQKKSLKKKKTKSKKKRVKCSPQDDILTGLPLTKYFEDDMKFDDDYHNPFHICFALALICIVLFNRKQCFFLFIQAEQL